LEAIVKDHTAKAYLHFTLMQKTALKMNSIITCWLSWTFWSLSGMPFEVHIKHGIATGNICCLMVC